MAESAKTTVDRFLAIYVLLGLVLLVAGFHAVFPRYEWRMIDQAGRINVVVYDKWTGRIQRAFYDDSGKLNVMAVYTPF